MILRPRRQQYQVKQGDNLWNIAHNEYGDATVWPELAQANSVPNGNTILVGMTLKLPPTLKGHRRYSGAGASKPIRPQAIHSSPLGPVNPRDFADAPKAQVLGPQRPGSVPIHHDAPQDRLSLLNMPPAKAVTFPTLRYKFADVKITSVLNPYAEYQWSFTGEIDVQRKGLMESVDLATSGDVTKALKAEYDSRIVQITDEVRVKPSTDWKTAEVSCGLIVATNINGWAFVNQSLTLTSPNNYKCSVKPAEIAGEVDGFAFRGSLGFEVAITKKDSKISPPIAVWITVGTIATLGDAVVVEDIAKEAGWGEIGWSAAMSLYGQTAAE
jgi:LysM repeat protein